MEKQEAMQRLQVMQAEMDKLKAIIEKPDTPEVFQGRYLREGLGKEHWWLSQPVKPRVYIGPSDGGANYGECFVSQESANQHFEHLRLMQEARIAMATDWGGEKADWTRVDTKYVIVFINNEVVSRHYVSAYSPIHFRTHKARDEFMAKYTQEQLKLMIMGVQ